LEYAAAAFRSGRYYLAYAELKTAAFLGADEDNLKEMLSAYRQALPDHRIMAHNQFYRFKTLAAEIIKRSGGGEVSVLDVGGGEGALCAFLPEDAAYCLAEPGVNGLSGTDLPFADKTFDLVVACHVLEHVPREERSLFLDQLSAKSRKGVVLLNPFHVEGTHVNERLKLFLEITKASWAREHLECSLPRVEDVKRYASDRGMQITVKPNGSLTTSTALVFADHFASRAGLHVDWKKMNAFFNEKFCDKADNAECPNAYLVYLSRHSQ
jgi:SAM-dependent methyltransferase